MNWARTPFLLLSLLAACARLPAIPEAIDEVDHWKREASELRGLEFLAPVHIEWIRSAEIPDIARAEVEELFSPEYVEAYRDAYVALGLLPRDLDLLETVLALQADQLVGLYSVARRTLYVVVNRPGELGPPMILVHELVHALQHQHFPELVSVLQGVENSDDLVSALSAVLEGDASLTMLAVEDPSEEARGLRAAERFKTAMLVDLEHATGLLAEVPLLLRVSLIAPYAHGVVIAAERYSTSGDAGLDELLRAPPLATVQVLYRDVEGPIEFVRLPLEWLEAHAKPEGCALGHHNTAGALTLQVFFEQFAPGLETEPLLRRWRGDRFLHLACADGDRLLWVLRWEDEESARVFAEAYRVAAPAAAKAAALPEVPVIQVDGRDTLVVSPRLSGLADEFLAATEFRPYATFSDWIGDGCFPELECPKADAAATARYPSHPTPP